MTKFSFLKNVSLGLAGREGASEKTKFSANIQTEEMMQQKILYVHNNLS